MLLWRYGIQVGFWTTLLACTTRAETLRIDIGHTSTASSTNEVQSGFEDLSAANQNGQVMGRATETWSRTFGSSLGEDGHVSVSLESPDPASRILAFRDRGNMSTELGDLAEDFVFNEAQLNLTVAGLKPGLYAMTTWHHDPQYVGGMIDIKIGSRTVVGGLVQTTGFSTAPASAAFAIEVAGGDPVVIQIVSQSRDDAFVAYLNGFCLTPATLVATFDVDHSESPVTLATGGADGGAYTSIHHRPGKPTAGTSPVNGDGVTTTLAAANSNDFRDNGATGGLSGSVQANLLRDFVWFDSSASEHRDGNLTVDIDGLEPGCRYLLTWYAYDNGLDVGHPMFVYQDRVAEETLLFTNVDTFLYTKANDLRRESSPNDAAYTFLATTNDRGKIHLIAGRGGVIGSNNTNDGPTDTILNGLTIGTTEGLSKIWLASFVNRPAAAARTAVNPLGDSLAKDYSTEVELIPPTEPGDAEATFEVEPGFRVELVAAEPLVMDPVGMSFDERGRLFVAEMRGYNQGNRVPCSDARKLAMETEKLGCVKLLEDIDGDGRFDKHTVYVDDLIWPNGVFAYDGGVFVAAAPDLLYCKDTDGDGRADIRDVVLTGFGYGNWQHLPNSFRWGLDSRIHGASASGGGSILCPTRPDEKAVQLRGRDFAFDPRTLHLTPTNNSAQFGLSFDDWGRKFVCSNSAHIFLVFYEDRYVARNPYLAAPGSSRLIAAAGTLAPVFRISPPEPHRVVWMRMRTSGVIKGIIEKGGAATGFITAAGGTTIYRGDAWPANYRNNSFTPECSGNLVHRNVLEPDGVGLVARRVDKNREFLSSRDIWFRPVNMRNGPDGNLYIADMYRQVINEGVVLPPTLRKCFDLTEGCSRGRIYRVVPDGFTQPKIPDLSKATTTELVKLLEHPNAWHHVSAARLLYQRQDTATIGPLEQLAVESSSPLGRLHAMYALDSLAALSAEAILPRLDDQHPRVRQHAVRLAEKVLADSSAVGEKLFSMVRNEDLLIRYQLAFTLGEIPGDKATAALAAIAARDATDRWVRLAVLSSATGRTGDLFAHLAADPEWRSTAGGRTLLEQLAEQTGLHGRADQVDEMAESLEKFTDDEKTLLHVVVRGLLRGMDSLDSPLRQTLVQRRDSVLARARAEMLDEARRRARDPKHPIERRVEAIRSLTLGSYDEADEILAELLDSRQPQAVALAAMETLGRFSNVAVAQIIVDVWAQLTPRLRSAATEALFARRERLPVLLAAIDDGTVHRSQLDPARIQMLLAHTDGQIRKEATRLLGSEIASDREEVVAAYRESLEMASDIGRGKAVFKRECAKCHRLEGVGFDLGLPLATIKDRGKEGILLNLLDPNRNINPQYVNYIVVTDQGRSISGMIAAEAANSMTLKRGEGESDTVLRANIDELFDTGLSIMPEGLEKQLTKQDVADVIGYLMSIE